MILAVHFQYMDDNGKLAKELFNSRKIFLALIVPNLLDPKMKTEEGDEICNRLHPSNNYYPDWAKEIFRENSHNPNIIWGEEGYRHCCGRCYNEQQKTGKNLDPYHEHVCLDGQVQSLEKQIEVIQKGKQLIKKELGITPTVYRPPNDLYNKNIFKAVKENGFNYVIIRNGFDYFIPGLIKLPAYEDNELNILPETKKGKSPLIMVYYDDMSKNDFSQYEDILNSSEYLFNLDISRKPIFKSWINEKLIIEYKKLRDKK